MPSAISAPELPSTPPVILIAASPALIKTPTMTTYGQNWKLAGGAGGGEVGSDESQHRSETLVVEVPVAFFIDDLEINAVKEAGKNEIKVNLHSKSRTGNNDFGENKRHILQLLEVLDKKFGR
jgi:hypothetical protein